MTTSNWAKVVLVGLVTGLAATLVVDAILISVLRLSGQPAEQGFVVIGDTAAGFLTRLRINLAGGAPLGLAIHFSTGAALGVLFAGVVSRVRALRMASWLKMAALGVVYTELISIPLLIWPPIILKMPQSEVIQWFTLTASLHAVFGLVLGLTVRYGLGAALRAQVPPAGLRTPGP